MGGVHILGTKGSSFTEYTFIIGATDEFTDVGAMIAYCESVPLRSELERNVSIFSVVLPSDLRVVEGLSGYTSEQLAESILQGEAFASGWCLDDTCRALIMSPA